MWLKTIIDLVVTFGQIIAPWYVLKEYEGGVVLFFGCFTRYAKPGFHWKIPIIETVMFENVAYETKHTYSQKTYDT